MATMVIAVIRAMTVGVPIMIIMMRFCNHDGGCSDRWHHGYQEAAEKCGYT
jgi:hypothetical protein